MTTSSRNGKPRHAAASANGAQKVKTRSSADRAKQGLSSAATLVRTAFRTSREMDFFNEKELVKQTGHEVDEWPLVIVKELVDNALDACETAKVAPQIGVTADAAGITVTDNGPGLPEATLKGAMDFTVRVSDKEAYVSPCRGAQGNALKTLLPMPWVVEPGGGRMIVTAHDQRHVITCGVNVISQRPVVNDDAADTATDGTTVRLEWTPCDDRWGRTLWPFNNLCPREPRDWDESFAERLRRLVEGFALFNPHATIRLDWFGEVTTWEATDVAWRKWKPHQPTSPHWYELPHLKRLIGAYVTDDREHGTDRFVRDFLAKEFDGLSGSAKRKKVLEATGLHRAYLSELVKDNAFDDERIGRLLSAMRHETKPVAPARLGIIGEDHLRLRLLAMGVTPESFRYDKKLNPKSKNSQTGADDKPCFPEPPSVLECAFGWLGDKARDRRRIYAGTNWTSAITNPFRTFGGTGQGLETVLANLKATRHEPIVYVLHLAHPRVGYTDAGKSALVIGGGK